MDCDRVEADRKGTWSDRKVAWTRPEIQELEARIGVAIKSFEARWDEVRREGRWLRSNGWTVRIDELEPSFFSSSRRAPRREAKVWSAEVVQRAEDVPRVVGKEGMEGSSGNQELTSNRSISSSPDPLF